MPGARLVARGREFGLQLGEQPARAFEVAPQPERAGDLRAEDPCVVPRSRLERAAEPLLADLRVGEVPQRVEVEGHGPGAS